MQNPHLPFVQLKIAEIGTAIFSCDNNTILPFSAYIIRALKTNEEGFIWFFISRDWNKLVFTENIFQGKLEFYKKGFPFTLKIEGKAQLIHKKVETQALLSFPINEGAHNGVLLVR